jgi:TatD DNase family protein
MLTDTHCHLDFEHFDADRDAVIQRAAEAGIARILNPAIDLPTSRRAVALAEQYEMVYAAVGVHPNSAGVWDADTAAELRDLAAHPKVAAIGEIGLDYYWDKAPHDVQARVLRAQLELAGDLGLPVVIHNREAGLDILPLLAGWQAELAAAGNPLAGRPGVLHSFSGTEAEAFAGLEANFCIGITGPVTFKNARDWQGVVARLPLESLLMETDAPYLTPHPFRGTRNEPARAALVAEKVAELKGLSFENVTQAAGESAARVLGW